MAEQKDLSIFRALKNLHLQFIRMSEASLVIAGVRVCVSGHSATAAGSDSGVDFNIIVPSSVFFPWLARTLAVTRIGRCAFEKTPIISITIPRHVQILCSSCFSDCKSLSSISFETDCELTRIESNAFSSCSSLKSITIPRHVQILCSLCFSHCDSLSSISFETSSELTRIETGTFAATQLHLVVVPESTSFIAGDAFPRHCAVTSVLANSNAKLREWNLGRRLGSSDAFERKP
jgi:hypothetical protein